MKKKKVVLRSSFSPLFLLFVNIGSFVFLVGGLPLSLCGFHMYRISLHTFIPIR